MSDDTSPKTLNPYLPHPTWPQMRQIHRSVCVLHTPQRLVCTPPPDWVQ